MSNTKLTGLFYIKTLFDMGYSYNQLNQLSGLPLKTIYNWVNGKTKPNKHIEAVVKMKLEAVYDELIKEVKATGRNVNELLEIKMKGKRNELKSNNK